MSTIDKKIRYHMKKKGYETTMKDFKIAEADIYCCPICGSSEVVVVPTGASIPSEFNAGVKSFWCTKHNHEWYVAFCERDGHVYKKIMLLQDEGDTHTELKPTNRLVTSAETNYEVVRPIYESVAGLNIENERTYYPNVKAITSLLVRACREERLSLLELSKRAHIGIKAVSNVSRNNSYGRVAYPEEFYKKLTKILTEILNEPVSIEDLISRPDLF